MKKILLILILFLSIISYSQTQKRVYKKFTDTIFNAGDRIIPPQITWDLGWYSLRPESKDSIIVIANWMKKHPNFKIEIGCHSDSRGKATANMTLTVARAQSIVDYMTKELNIPLDKVVAKGYGKTELLFSDEEIKHAKTKYDKEPLHQKNRRTEVKILAIE